MYVQVDREIGRRNCLSFEGESLRIVIIFSFKIFFFFSLKLFLFFRLFQTQISVTVSRERIFSSSIFSCNKKL